MTFDLGSLSQCHAVSVVLLRTAYLELVPDKQVNSHSQTALTASTSK